MSMCAGVRAGRARGGGRALTVRRGTRELRTGRGGPRREGVRGGCKPPRAPARHLELPEQLQTEHRLLPRQPARPGGARLHHRRPPRERERPRRTLLVHLHARRHTWLQTLPVAAQRAHAVEQTTVSTLTRVRSTLTTIVASVQRPPATTGRVGAHGAATLAPSMARPYGTSFPLRNDAVMD